MKNLAFLVMAFLVFAPGIGSADGMPADVVQMFQQCVASGGQAASNYNAWVAQHGCLCGSPLTGSGNITCSGGSGSSASTGGGGDLATLVTTASVKAIFSGNSQAAGYGVLGLGASMLLEGMQSNPEDDARQQAAAAAQAAQAERIRALEAQRQAEIRRQQEEAFQHSKGVLLDTLQGPDGGPEIADNGAANKVAVIPGGGYNFHQSEHFTTSQPSQPPRLADQLLGPDDTTPTPAPADQSANLANQMMGPDGGAPAVNEIGMTQGRAIGGAGLAPGTQGNAGPNGPVGTLSKGDIVPQLDGSDEAVSAAAQKPFDSAGAAPVVSMQTSQGGLTGNDVASKQGAAQDLGVPNVQLSDAALSRLVPLLREQDPGGPIGSTNRPAICEPLSQQLDATYQLARRAVLASDIYDRYKSKDVPLPVIAGFDRISDQINHQQITEMRKLLPGMSGESIRHLLQPDDSDFRAAIYEEYVTGSDGKNNYSKNVFLVFRGTVPTSGSDWMEGNAAQATGVGSDYYTRAIVLAHDLKQSAAANGYQLEIIGHSLGGGMADAAGLANRIKTTSFNPSGVNPNTVRGADISMAPQYLTDYVVNGEPLNSHQDHPAMTMAQVYGGTVMTGSLIPSVLVNSAASDPARAKRYLQELTTLYSVPLPTAIGRRVTLAPDPGDLNSVDPFALHYMTSVVDAIVAHSRELQSQYDFNECGS